jgi:glycine/D-amino acid oxidase-like deaminating enzyme
MDLRSGHPFWQIKNGILGTYPGLTEDQDCEVAIIGGGITGALIADRLCSAGVDVLLLDKRDMAEGSTAASTSLLQSEIDVELVELAERLGETDAVRCYRVGLEAIDSIERRLAGLGDTCGFARRPSLYLASAEQDVPRLRKEYTARREHGFDVEFLESADIAREFPFNAPAAIRSRGDAEIDAFRLTHRLLEAARRLGLRAYDRTSVTTIRRSSSRSTLETDRGPTVSARRVVFATGYESQQYLRQNVGRLSSTFAVASEPMQPFPTWPDRCLIWETARPYFYLRTTPDDRVIVGGEDSSFSNDHQRDELIQEKSERLVARFAAMFPGADFELAYAWAGTFGETEDGLAYIGEPPERPGDLFAVGYGGNGITMGVVAADIIAESCLGRSHPDARLFRFDR